MILDESYERIFFALTYFGPEFAPLGKSMKLLIGNMRRTLTCFVSKSSLEFLAFFNLLWFRRSIKFHISLVLLSTLMLQNQFGPSMQLYHAFSGEIVELSFSPFKIFFLLHVNKTSAAARIKANLISSKRARRTFQIQIIGKRE